MLSRKKRAGNDRTMENSNAAGIRKTPVKAKTVFGLLFTLGYDFCYIIGVDTVRMLRFVGKRLWRFISPAVEVLYDGLDWLLLRHLRGLAAEVRRIKAGFRSAGERIRTVAKQNPLLLVPQILVLPFWFARRHKKILSGFLNLAFPIAAAFILVLTVQYFNGMTFGLQLEYGGKSLGYIADESTFNSAAYMAQNRVADVEGFQGVNRDPKLTLSVVPQAQIQSETEICDKILSSSVNSLAEATGLYINGQFQGAVLSKMELDNLLQSIKDQWKANYPNDTVAFVPSVTEDSTPGLYPISATVTAANMKAKLTARNPDGSLYLPVARHDIQTREEPIPYTQTTQDDPNKYIGYSKVTQKGIDGVWNVSEDVVYINDQEVSRSTVSMDVQVPMIPEVTTVGTLVYNPGPITYVIPSNVPNVTPNQWLWPIPACKVITSPFAMRWGRMHTGVDISGGALGQQIIASRAGTVVYAGYDSGYGNHIIIDHGDGFQSLYAHAEALNVQVGDQVQQGQVIALAGETGHATGPHLHFEIRYNGVPVDPVPYIGWNQSYTYGS